MWVLVSPSCSREIDTEEFPVGDTGSSVGNNVEKGISKLRSHSQMLLQQLCIGTHVLSASHAAVIIIYTIIFSPLKYQYAKV